MFCYQAAAYRRSEGIARVVTFGSPVDLRGALPLGLPESIAIPGATFTVDVLAGRAVPAWVTRNAFSLLDPVHVLRQRLDFVRQLHDREALLPREGQRRFLMGQGWVAWPGPGRRRVRPPVPGAQPDARRRLHHRRPHGDARRHRRPDPVLRRRPGRHRPGPGGPRHPAGRAARPDLRGVAAGRPLRPRGRPDRRRAHLAGRQRVGALAVRRHRRSCPTSPATSTRPARWCRVDKRPPRSPLESLQAGVGLRARLRGRHRPLGHQPARCTR